MTVTLIVSGEGASAPVRHVWLNLAAHMISLWGLLLSIVLPIIKRQAGPPLTVQTVASRYRLLTPEPRRVHRSSSAKEFGEFGVTLPRTRMQPRQPVRSRNPCPVGHGSPTAGLTFYEFAALSANRSYSMSASNVDSSSCPSHQHAKSTSTRPRSASCPECRSGTSGSRSHTSCKWSPLRARRCTTLAAVVVTGATAPARPLLERARTVIQRPFFTAEPDDDTVLVRRTVLQVARKRTKNAINRSASVATAAFMTASQMVTPMPKANMDAEWRESEGVLDSGIPPAADMHRPRMGSRRSATRPNVRFLRF